MTSWVHRYTLRELMDDSFDLFKERAIELLLAGLIPCCLFALYWLLVRTLVFPGNLLTDLETIDELIRMWQFWIFFLVLPGFVVIPVTLSLMLIFQCRVAIRHVLGDDYSVIKTFRLLTKPFFSLIVVAIVFFFMQFAASLVTTIVSLIIIAIFNMLGMIFMAASEGSGTISASLIVGIIIVCLGSLISFALSLMVYLGVCALFMAAPVTLAYEHAGPFRAIGQSFNIALSNFKTQFLALYVIFHVPAVLSILMLAITLTLYMPFRYFAPGFSVDIIVTLFLMIFAVICTGMLACLQTLNYIDGRCRRDAFDLQLLAADIGLGEEFARLYTPGIRLQPVQYPNYAVMPNTGSPAPPPIVMPPNYAASPLAGNAIPSPGAVMPAPDYSAPPPPVAAYPDYSAPPPPPAEPPPPPPVIAAESSTEREDADGP